MTRHHRGTGTSPTTARIHSLDTIRGVAVLGILPMNAVSFGLGSAAYFNISASAPQSTASWIVGALGEILVDQKFMAIFSMLFGAGIVLFSERAEATGRPWWIALRRNAILLVIGVLHTLLWDGDVLLVYALCAPPLLLLRRLPSPVLLTLSAALLGATMAGAALTQQLVDAGSTSLGDYWGSGPIGDLVFLWLLGDGFARALALMLVGVVAYRSGFIRGTCSARTYRRTLLVGATVGLAVSTAGYVVVAVEDFSPQVALVGTIPTTLGTVPLALAYVSAIVLWQRHRAGGNVLRRLQSVGRMALTNYLSQTLLGVLVLGIALAPLDLDRVGVLAVVVGIWALQLWWSDAWLARFRFGPAEWLWRWATYGRRPTLRA